MLGTKEINQIRYYSRRLAKLLSSDKEQPTLTDHSIQEEQLQANPDIKIVFSLKMPTSVQALRWELQYLQEECRMLLREQEWDSTLPNPKLDLLKRRMHVVEYIMKKIIKEEVLYVAAHVPRLRNLRLLGFMGDNWYMRFVERTGEEKTGEGEI